MNFGVWRGENRSDTPGIARMFNAARRQKARDFWYRLVGHHTRVVDTRSRGRIGAGTSSFRQAIFLVAAPGSQRTLRPRTTRAAGTVHLESQGSIVPGRRN
jgi:hypothetical protein